MRDGKHVILCVDDDQDILASLRLVLESAGYEVVTAATADEGRAALQAARPDLLVVDLMMEQVDAGLSFVSSLREAGVTTPVFFLSSAGDYLYEMADVGRLGADGVFQKPLSPDLLLSVIAGRLGQTAAAATGRAVTSG
jgi:DNA-binding response OmpR family regulator